MKQITDNLDFIKIKNFSSAKETEWKDKPQNFAGICKLLSDKGLVPKEIINLNHKKKKQQAQFKMDKKIWAEISPKNIRNSK